MAFGRNCAAVGMFAVCASFSSALAQGIAPTWMSRFDGPASYNDFGKSGVVLPSGAIAITGTAYKQQPGVLVPQFFTAAYSPQGVELWSKLYGSGYYSGNGNGDLIAIGPGNRLIVAGSRDLGGDWVALQYDFSGTQLSEGIWLANSWFVSSPSGIASDAAGNVYLAGDVGDPVTFDFRGAVVKFAPAGNVIWSRMYDDQGLAIGSVSGIAMDAAGGVYLVGSTTAVPPSYGTHFSVARIDPANGSPIWIRNHGTPQSGYYNLGRKIEIDGAGNLIAGGDLRNDVATAQELSFVSYQPDGTLLWRYDHPAVAQSKETLADMAIASGAVAGVGRSISPNGENVWITVSVSGGQLGWERTFSGLAPTAKDGATAVAIDAQGNVTVTGYADAPNESLEVIMYAPDGIQLGHGSVLAPLSGYSRARDVVVSPGGRAYVIGDINPFPGTGGDAVSVAFDLNPVSVYCTAKTNSLGCVPAMQWTGSPSASATSGFVVSGANVRNNKNGLLFYGTNGAAALPFQGGTLCVKSPLRRTGAVNSAGNPAPANDCSGSYAIDMAAFAHSSGPPTPSPELLVPGTIVHCQWWGRDPGFAPPNNITLTDALSYTVQI